jgi:hypothetical protein
MLTVPRACVAAAGLLAVGRPILAGEAEPAFPPAGSRVRVRSLTPTAEPFVGTLTASDQRVLTVVPLDGSEARAFSRVDITRLERRVRQGRKKKGAIIGLGVGFAVGLAGTFALCESFGTSCPTGEGFVYGTLYGSAVGALGAGVGALVAHGEQWEDVPLDVVLSGEEWRQRPAGDRWAIVPLVGGHRRGLTIVLSF